MSAMTGAHFTNELVENKVSPPLIIRRTVEYSHGELLETKFLSMNSITEDEYQLDSIKGFRSTRVDVRDITCGDNSGWFSVKWNGPFTSSNGVFGTTHKCRRPSSLKATAAFARDMVSTTVYGDVLVIGWRSTYISISSGLISKSSSLRPFPDPAFAKSKAWYLFNVSAPLKRRCAVNIFPLSKTSK
ncbi:hypothetical protein Ccrd_026099 [Cynara cardunculus var. scolymus]|uniref:Uncharacterized protein n=1 Tax=Cynara cardunculus var. scolymus TaxID=59895 RepID=A0A103XDD8_CYNCS|nr:hypothetical protein Ccrd_026099 [Cynara cardunculus var. scolymus]